MEEDMSFILGITLTEACCSGIIRGDTIYTINNKTIINKILCLMGETQISTSFELWVFIFRLTLTALMYFP